MLLSIIVPAFNEETIIGETLASLQRAQLLNKGLQSEIIVVDNESTDSTSDIARALGVKVIRESQHNIARARNAGASISRGEILVFVDADTIVPDKFLSRVAEVMSDTSCLGGAVDVHHRPAKLTVRAYLQLWRIIGKVLGMAQGATQFYRRDVFQRLQGYDETLFMGEDVDLYWRLQRYAKRHNAAIAFIDDIQVVPATRRFDQWPLWRTLLWTNPLIILMFRRNKILWRSWYEKGLR
jgi:glycosyltransferase involved in cell wall biosynthesis